jgi:hypothetical protein
MKTNDGVEEELISVVAAGGGSTGLVAEVVSRVVTGGAFIAEAGGVMASGGTNGGGVTTSGATDGGRGTVSVGPDGGVIASVGPEGAGVIAGTGPDGGGVTATAGAAGLVEGAVTDDVFGCSGAIITVDTVVAGDLGSDLLRGLPRMIALLGTSGVPGGGASLSPQ